MTGKIVKSSLYSYSSCVHLRQCGPRYNAIWHRPQTLTGTEANVKELQHTMLYSYWTIHYTSHGE